MTNMRHFVSLLSPGARLDLDDYEGDEKKELLDELEGQGYVLDSKNRVGEIAICSLCEGEGDNGHRVCHFCDGAGTVVDFGEGARPYYD
jgi:hypothetical protein